MVPEMFEVLLRVLVWGGLPLLLVVLGIGPRRVWGAVKRGWAWLWTRRLDPEEVLTRVVQGHQKHVADLRDVVSRAEAAEAEIGRHLQTSEDNIVSLDKEARKLAGQDDDLGARAALYRLNLERAAADTFRQQRQRQQEHIADLRRHLYLMELRLRQYEVGRQILLAQLAEAKTVEQQAAIAAGFDPFNAVATWQRAEGMVEEKALTTRARARVYADTAEMPLTTQPARVDPDELDAQLAALKSTGIRARSAQQ
jgi:phage shock protein A